MKLARSERDWYRVTITTDPALTGTWQASFDDGTTWIDGTKDDTDGSWVWLLAGPDFDASAVGMDAADTDATISTSGLKPKLRIADDPVLDIEAGPFIYLA